MIKKETFEKGSSSLERRLYNCRKFNPRGPETQTEIAREYGFSDISMSNHLKKHQNPKEAQVLQNRLEYNLAQETKRYQTAQDLILEKGIEGIESGDIRLTANTVASVSRDKMNQEERNKDRQVKVMEMIYAFTSGELHGGNSLRAPGDITEGQG